MCADLVNPDRLRWVDPLHPTTEQKIAADDGTFAYCGRYEIDAKNNRLVHLPEVATGRGYEGSRQIRASLPFGGQRTSEQAVVSRFSTPAAGHIGSWRRIRPPRTVCVQNPVWLGQHELTLSLEIRSNLWLRWC